MQHESSGTDRNYGQTNKNQKKLAPRIIKLQGNYNLFLPDQDSDENKIVPTSTFTSIVSSGLVFKLGSEVNRISDLICVPSRVLGI